MAVDTLIKDALILDGSGQPGYPGDIAINAGRITGVGKTGERAANVVNAAGLAAAPGFWDVHTHYDVQLLWDPLASCSNWHGVTTVVMGNCGFTVAPVRPDDQGYLLRLLARVEAIERAALERTLPWKWESFGEYLDVLDRRLGVNVIAQVGHSAVRRYVLGKDATERAATPEEIEAMRHLVRESLRAGGMGFTSSRSGGHWDGEGQPVPSRLATVEEYTALVAELRHINCGFIEAAFGGEPELNRATPEGVATLAGLTEATGRPYCAMTIMQTGMDPPGAWKQRLDTLQAQIAAGHRFFGLGKVDLGGFEMTFENTNLFDRWPTWQRVMIEPLPERMAQMRDPALRARLRDEMAVDTLPIVPINWELTTLVDSRSGRWRNFEGQTVPEIARALGKDPLDAAFDLALDEELKTQFRIADTRFPERDIMMDILKAPNMVPGEADSGAHLLTQIEVAFPTRLLGYWARERGLITLEEAVNILAARPADIAGVTDRGRLLPGQAADIVLFDPASVRDGPREFVNDLPGGGKRLIQRAHGIEAVFVNGVLTRERNHDTGDLAGRVLRSTDYDLR